MRQLITFVLSALCLAGLCTAASMPQLVKHGSVQLLHVDGKPYFVIGAQVNNSSGWPARLSSLWPTLHSFGVNTVEIPVYWEDIEPQEGQFRFNTVDAILEQARNNRVHLTLLWFATWKNGAMDYVPEWVKRNPGRFPHMLNEAQQPIRVLSPHSEANLDADRRAFTALMHHLKQVDSDQHTVILIQIENEAGSLGSVRDFSPAANRLFEQQVPIELTKALGKPSGTWSQAFGVDADETFAAYAVARYINEIAASGKKEFALPMYVNNWLRERNTFLRPGEGYPSGGPTTNMLAVWKAVTPAIEIVAPDIYLADYPTYQSICRQYKRSDNPLLIPETGASLPFARNAFYAIGDYGAVGIAPFGADRMGNAKGELVPAVEPMAANFRLLAKAQDQIPVWQTEHKIHALVEEEFVTQRLVDFTNFQALALFGDMRFGIGGLSTTGTAQHSGRVLIAETAPDDFYVLGFDAHIQFAPKPGSAKRNAQFVCVEEGEFKDGVWQAVRRLNGDETAVGIVLPPQGALLHVKLTTY